MEQEEQEKKPKVRFDKSAYYKNYYLNNKDKYHIYRDKYLKTEKGQEALKKAAKRHIKNRDYYIAYAKKHRKEAIAKGLCYFCLCRKPCEGNRVCEVCLEKIEKKRKEQTEKRVGALAAGYEKGYIADKKDT